MRVVMEIQRRGERYEGSLTRDRDQLCLPFAGTLELLAMLERLGADEPEPSPEPGDGGSA